MTFTDLTATTRGDASYCGARTYPTYITPPLTFSFISITSSASTIYNLTINTTNPSDSGTYSVDLTVSLTNYSTFVASVTKTFTVIIECEVINLTYLTQPAVSSTVKVGVTLQPYKSMSFSMTKSPNCATPVIFDYNPK